MWQQVAPHCSIEVKLAETQDPWERVERINRAKILSTHVSCWTTATNPRVCGELYCSDDDVRGRGVTFYAPFAISDWTGSTSGKERQP